MVKFLDSRSAHALKVTIFSDVRKKKINMTKKTKISQFFVRQNSCKKEMKYHKKFNVTKTEMTPKN